MSTETNGTAQEAANTDQQQAPPTPGDVAAKHAPKPSPPQQQDQQQAPAPAQPQAPAPAPAQAPQQQAPAPARREAEEATPEAPAIQQDRDALTADGIPQWVRDQITRANSQAAEARTKAKAIATELAVYRAAPKNADMDLLMDSTTFRASLTDLDPADNAAIAAHVTGFLQEHPRYARPQAGHSTADVTGSDASTITAEEFKAMTTQERSRLARDNRALFDRLIANI